MSAAPLPVIFGCAGPELSADERALFRRANPLGFILFGRNIADPAQVKRLVASFRETVGREDAPVLIDQEGGRVARLKPPHWRAAPSAGKIGALAATRGLHVAAEAARLNNFLIAAELAELGIDVDCAPVADVPVPGAHDIIGDRAYGSDAETVGRLAREAAEGLLDGGVIPVIKHIPGHGRARADSHAELPVVEIARTTLSRTDFAAFRPLADLPWAMTAHVLYSAIDSDRAATTSPRVIEEVIRGEIGFGGVLVSDDLSMKALRGDLASRAEASLQAGCDLVLHCTGDFAEMKEVAGVLSPLQAKTAVRLERGRAMRRRPDMDRARAAARLDELLGATTTAKA